MTLRLLILFLLLLQPTYNLYYTTGVSRSMRGNALPGGGMQSCGIKPKHFPDFDSIDLIVSKTSLLMLQSSLKSNQSII